MMSVMEKYYTRLSTSSPSESDPDSELVNQPFLNGKLTRQQFGSSIQQRKSVNSLHSVLLIASALALFLAGYLISRVIHHDSCKYNFDDPKIVPRVVLDYLRGPAGKSSVKQSNLPLIDLDPDKPLWTRSEPSPEVDKFWDKFTDATRFLITAEDLRRMGRDPERYVKVPLEFGYGEDAYPAKAEVFHQLHCVNLLRKFLRKEHYFPNLTEQELVHADHCVASLYDTLSCHINWDVYNFVWIEGIDWPQHTLEVTRECRDLTQVWDFVNEHNIRDQRIEYLVPQPGDNILKPDIPITYPDKKHIDRSNAHRHEKFEQFMASWRASGEVPLKPYRDAREDNLG